MLSDHNFIGCSLHTEKPKPQTKKVTYRKLKNTDIKKSREDMGEALVAAYNYSDLAALVDMYNVKLSTVLDNHAPQKTKTVKISHRQPWFNDFIKEQIVLRRKKEKTFRLDPTDYNYQAFYYRCRYVSNIKEHAKKQYYLESIKNCDRGAKSLFNLANKLLFRKEPLPLPKCDDNKILTDTFNNFFEDKTSKIMEKLTPTENIPVDNNYIEEIYHTNQRHHEFVMLNIEEVRKLSVKIC